MHTIPVLSGLSAVAIGHVDYVPWPTFRDMLDYSFFSWVGVRLLGAGSFNSELCSCIHVNACPNEGGELLRSFVIRPPACIADIIATRLGRYVEIEYLYLNPLDERSNFYSHHHLIQRHLLDS